MDKGPIQIIDGLGSTAESSNGRVILRYDLNSIIPTFVEPGKAAEIPLSSLRGMVVPMHGLVVVVDRRERVDDDSGTLTEDHFIRLGVKPSADRFGWRYEEVVKDGSGTEKSKKIEPIPPEGLETIDVNTGMRKESCQVRVYNGEEDLGVFDIDIRVQAKKIADDDRFSIVISTPFK